MARSHRYQRLTRAIVTGVLAALAALAFSSPALADPAGPTDYRSEIVSVEPSTSAVDVSILGGDSFVQLKVQTGTDVMVIGYRGEQYLWFQPDGTVLENQNSPTKYTNSDRYGGAEIPQTATADAAPDWHQI